MLNKTESLHDLLSLAATGDRVDRVRFYRALLLAKVFVPGGRKGESFMQVQHVNEQFVPVFTQREFVTDWAGEIIPTNEKEFQVLLFELNGPELWIHLDPGQEFGKELSPWEINCLKRGEDALEEIVADLDEATPDDVQVEDFASGNNEIKNRLISILEVHTSVQEAFLGRMKNQEQDQWSTLVGIKRGEMNSEKRLALLEEIKHALEDANPEDGSAIVVDDLGDANSPNRSLFENMSPFYYAQRELDSNRVNPTGMFTKLLSGFRGAKKKVKRG